MKQDTREFFAGQGDHSVMLHFYESTNEVSVETLFQHFRERLLFEALEKLAETLNVTMENETITVTDTVRKTEYETGSDKCTFCGTSKDEVKILIAGKDVAICNECIKLSAEIVREREGE